jgi:hypothetical protein
VGRILKLKGQVFLIGKNKKSPLTLTSRLFKGDFIETEKRSFTQIQLLDKSVYNVGPLSKMHIDELKLTPHRINIMSLIKGKVRANVAKKAKGKYKDKVILKTKSSSIGVRGTTFFVNSYLVKGKTTSDVLLLKGSVQTKIKTTNQAIQSTQMLPGQSLNTTQVIADGNLSSVKTLSKESLELIAKNENSLLPEMMDQNGKLIDLDKKIKEEFGTDSKKLKEKIKEKLKKVVEKEAKSEPEEEKESSGQVQVNIEKSQKKTSSGGGKNTNETNINVDY